MQTVHSILTLTEETKHLPKSSFYLGLADIGAEEAAKVLSSTSCRDFRIKIIHTIEADLRTALSLFSVDKYNYKQQEKQSFLQKKVYIDQKLHQLREKHMKMLAKEAIIV